MKHLILVFALLFSSLSFAQSAKQIQRNEKYLQMVDSVAEISTPAEAIQLYLEVINKGLACDYTYNNLGWNYILNKEPLKAIKYLKIGQQTEESNLMIKGNLAHAYLLNGDFEEAKAIYLKYRGQNVEDVIMWEEGVFQDFQTFEKNGIFSPYFDTIRELLSN